MVRTTRRALLGAAALVAAARPAHASDLAKGRFTHGVASGDPTSAAVILWTRFVPDDPASTATVRWEMAEDESFARVRAGGEATASRFDDWCVKVDAGGLQPGRRYFYRFLAAGGPSPVGRTCTTPGRGAPPLTFALFSCSNLPFGYFHAYADAAARDDIDLWFHVGDYIYEYQRGVYPSAQDAVAGRTIEPAGETITLSDYHARYASYRLDPALQELHRVKPFIGVWDDHELTNDAWWDGAQNHQPATEGDWTVRRMLAAKAYDDWMPIRRQTSLLQIYRRLDWGDLATLVMLDTRLIGREKQLDWRAALQPAMQEGGAALVKAAQTFAAGPLADPRRTLLGAPQEAWLRAELQRSKARGAPWQVLAQQLVTGVQKLPPAMAALLPADASAWSKQWAGAGATVGAAGFAWNLDSWSGYPAARTRFLQSCATDAANALVLSGDSHNAWANNLPGGKDGRPAAVEIATSSVSSTGFEKTFSGGAPGAREAAMLAANEELAWCDVTRRGYATAKLTRTAAEAEWIGFEDITKPEPGARTVTRASVEASARHGVGPWRFAR